MRMFACFTCFSVHTQPNLISDANVQNYAQVSHLGESNTFWMFQGRWESENNHPLPPFSHHPRLHPTHSGWPPPPAHHHQTPAAGSLPHLTPSSTHWAWVIRGALHHPWPPHLPPHWWNCPIWNLMMRHFQGVFSYFPKQLWGAVKWGEKMTSLIESHHVISRIHRLKFHDQITGNALYH